MSTYTGPSLSTRQVDSLDQIAHGTRGYTGDVEETILRHCGLLAGDPVQLTDQGKAALAAWAPQTPPAADRHAPSSHRATVEGDPGKGRVPIAPSPGLPTTCSDPYCTAPPTYETTTLYRDHTTGRMWTGTWTPQCTDCALDDANTPRTDHGLHGVHAIATTLRPIGNAS